MCSKSVLHIGHNTTNGNGSMYSTETKLEIMKMIIDGVIPPDEHALLSKGLVLICTEHLKMLHLHNEYSVPVLLHYTTLMGLSLSIVCLMVTITMHRCIGIFQTMPSRILLHLCMSLLFAHILFLVSPHTLPYQYSCKFVAAMQHICWLSSFLCMMSYAIAVCHALSHKMNQVQHQFKLPAAVHITICWGIPILLCTACTMLDIFTDQFIYGWETVKPSACWIQPMNALIYSFILPLAVTMFINCTCFTVSVFTLIKANTKAQLANCRKERRMFIASLKLASVLGFSWLFGLLANIDGWQG